MNFRSLYQLIVISIMTIISSYSFSQTDIFGNSVPTSIVTCGEADTVYVIVYSVNGASNVKLETNLTNNFEFVSLIPNSNITIVDTTNKNAPEFEFITIPIGGVDTIEFLIKSNCSSVSSSLQFTLFDSFGLPLGNTVISAQINADQPNVILTGFVNTNTGNQIGVDLSQLVLGQKYIRTFKVDYTSLVGDIDSVEVIVEKLYHDIFWVSGGTSSLSLTGDSILYKFKIPDFGGSPLSPTNNVFYFSDSVEFINCPSTSRSIDSDVELTWGCEGNSCQATRITTLGTIVVSNPVISYVATSSNLTDYCLLNKSYSFTVRNSQNATGTLADYAFDLVIQLPMVRNNSTMYNPASFPNTKIYDSVLINGQNVPFKAGAFGLYPLVDSLTAADYSNGGLTDENGDGFINDLKSDSSITVEVFYRNIGPNFTCNTGTSGRKIIYFYAHKALYVDFNNMCGEPMNQFRRQSYYQYLDFNSRTLSSSTSASNGTPFSINFNEWAQFARFDWTKVRLEKRFIVPKGVSVASPVNIVWNGVTNNGAVNYNIITKPGATFDTISVFTDRMRGSNNSDDNFTLDFVNDCSLNLDTCSELVIEASSFVWIDSGDITDPCYVSPIGCGTLTIIKDCDSRIKGYNIISQKLQRATFGWTDETRATKVNENTPGVVLDKVHPFDSIRLSATIVVQDTALDNLFFDINYTHLASTVDPIEYLTTGNNVTIKDVSSGSTFTFTNFTVTKSTQSTTEKTLRLDLSALRNSMRTATGNPLYQFGGDAGSSVFTNDTIELEFIMYGDQYRDYNINAQLLAYDNLATKAAIPTCIYRGAQIEIDHESERISRRTDNYGWRSCSRVFWMDIGFSYLDAGSTSNPATPITPKFDPAEYKPYTEFDSVYISWDESVYYFDTTETYYFTRYYYGGINIASTVNTLVMPKRFVRIISSNEVVVYMDSLAKRYAFGARDHLQAALPFRNACGRELTSNTVDQRFTYRLYRNLYPQAIGGPKTANSFSSFTSVSATTATLPELQLTVNTPSINASTDTVNWSIDVRNTNLTEMTPYTWIDIQSPSGGIRPVSISDGTKTYPILPYANGFWAKIDTILPNSSKNLIISADYTSCDDDSLNIRVGYSCSEYPIDPAQGYPNTGTVCNDVIKSGKLFLIAKSPLIQNLIIDQPDTAVELCDTLSYTLFSQNSGEVDVKNFKQQLILPVSTLSVVPATSELEWPANSGVWIPVPDPVLIVGTYEWDFSSYFKNGLLPNASIALDSNKFQLRFKLNSGCPFTSGDQVVFRVVASELCGDPVFSVSSASDPIIIQGLPAAPATVLTIEFEEDTVNICTNETSGSLLLINAVGGSTSGQERLIFEIDDTTITIQNPIFNVINGNNLVSLVPNDTVINNKRVLEWSLVPGVPAGDSISFDFKMISLDYTLSDCSRVPIKISTAEKHEILCQSTSALCDINFPISTTFDTLTIVKGELEIKNSVANQSNCVDSVSLNFTLKNNGAKVPTNYTKISFASDTNNNGILDANDAYFVGQDYLVTDSLNTGDSIIISHNITLDVDACEIFIIIDSTNCACSINDTLVPISFESSTNGLTICSLQSDSLPVCTDSKFKLQRTYTWIGLTAGSLTSYLSSPTIIKPEFTAPIVAIPTTLTYVLESNRGSCSSFDTINILVNPLPKSFTTTDTLICPNTIFSISPDTIETGITYSVWSLLNNGTNLGNTPYNVTVIKDTTYYLEAVNSTTGCSLSPRVAINLFEDSINPIVVCKDTTIYLEASGSFSIDTSFILVSASDNCEIDSAYVSKEAFDCSNIGMNSVTIYILDNKGNIDSCTSTITVLDTLSPNVVCKDTTIYLDITGSATIDTSFILQSVSDICGIDTVYISNNSFNCIDTGINSVTIYAEDVNGNLDSCVAIVTVLDTINPTVVCKDTTIYLDATGSFTIDTSFILVSATDICGIDSVYISKEAFDCSEIGANSITIFALDVSGNINSCVATVTVLDTINPMVVCKDTTIYLDANGALTIDTSFILSSVSDICGIDTVYISNNTFNCVDTGTNTVTIYAEDVNGNLDSCVASVTVLDTINPTVVCKDTTIYLDATGSFTIDTSFILSSVSDICGIDTVYISNNTFNCIDTGINSVTIYAEDVNGNLDSCVASVTVLDTINPTVVCKDTTVYLDANGSFTIDTSFILVSSTDICGIDTVYISNNTFSCMDTGINSITIYAEDVNGNIDSCIATVTVLDTINPTVVCEDTTVYLNATGSFTIDTSFILSSVTDICGIDTVYISNNTFSCMDIGINSVTIYAEDVNGNIDSCIATVTVLDTINPTVVCKDTTIYLDATGSFTIDTSFILSSVTDICGIDTVYISNNTFNCIDTGINSVTIYTEDVNGNIDSCVSTVTVLDTINPTVVCKDTTIYLNAVGTRTIDTSFILASVTDICGIDSVFISNNTFSCNDIGANNVTIYVTDFNGNIDSCVAIVTVLDSTNPVITCKDTTIFLDTFGTAIIDTSFVLASVSDICGIDTVYLSNNLFTCGSTGNNSVTIYVIDVNGNLDSCVSNVTVTVVDTINPVAICKTDTVYLDGTGNLTIDTSNVLRDFSDNCAVDSIYLSQTAFSCLDTGINAVTIYIIDVNGNIDSCVTSILVVDTLTPILTCKNEIIYLGASGSVSIDTSYVLDTYSSNCGIDTIYLSKIDFNCLDTGANSVTVYVQDNNGNIDSCYAIVTVIDTINPMVVCKDTTIYLDATGSFTIDTSFILSSVSDICGIDRVYISNNTFNCIDTGANSVTIYAEDVNGNIDSCIATVTVVDTINPMVVCKDTTIYLDANGSATIDTSFILVSATDICGIDSVYISNNSFSCADTGTNTVTIYVTDVNGNIDSCTSIVTILDTVNSIITCKDTTVYLNASGSVTIDTSYILVSITDACGIDSVYISNNSFSCSDTGSNSVTIYVKDISGNIDSCISTVTVLDTSNSIITCKDTTIYLDATGLATIDTSFILVSIADACGIDSVYISNNSFSCSDTGTKSITIYVIDLSGNIDSCISTVTVIDTVKPIVICHDTLLYLDTTGSISLDTSMILVSTNDACGIDSVYLSSNSLSCIDTGANIIIIFSRDVNGNIDSCTSVVTIVDTINPMVVCKDTTIYLDVTGSATIDTSFILVSATDICGIDSAYISNNTFNCIDTGSNTVTIYVTDVNGNLDSCIAIITVVDTINPMVVCKDTTIYLDATGSATIDTSYILVSATDICGIDSVYISNTTFNCIDTGSNTVTIYATDVNGNLDSCIATITVLDTINPIVVCKDTTIYLDAITGSITIDTSFILVSTTDICGIDSVYISNNTFSCSDTGTNSVTIYVTDVNGNLDSCISTVTVLDTINPVVICNDTSVYLDAFGSVTIDTSFILVSVTDVCGIDSVYISNNSFNCIDTGINFVTIYVQDVNGKLDSCIATVNVIDTINPMVVCKDTTIYLDATGSATIDTSYILVSATDICGIDSVYISNNTFNCIDTGSNTVTIYVTDVNGNLDSCISTVTVLDTINPIVTCKDTTVYVNATGSVTIDTSFILVSATDICGIDSVYISNNTFSCIDTGTNTVTIYVTDVNGNLDSCISTITVVDTINPNVICKDTTIYLDALGTSTIDTSFILVSATDICGIDSVYISNNTFNCIDTGTNTVTIYVTDVNGNIDSCVSTVTVLDTINPVVICKADTIYLDGTGNISIDTSNVVGSFFDNCTVDTLYLSNSDFTCIDTGNNSVTVYIVDGSGNLDSCQTNVRVLDTINPVVICKNDVIYLDGTGNATIDTSNVVSSFSDNCSVDTIYLSNYNYSCGDTGLNFVTVYIEDINGNIDSCQAGIFVRDTLTPIVVCSNATVYLNSTGIAIIDSSFVLSSFSSNCTIDTVYLSDTSFTCVDTGVNFVWVYVKDINGNIDSCMSIVTVLDSTAPIIVCRDTTVYLNTAGNISIDSSYVLSSFTDNCVVKYTTLSRSSFSCVDTGVNSVLIIAYDPSGNLDSCRSNVTVLDTIPPTAICMNTTVFLDSFGTGVISVSDINNGSFDNCAIATILVDKTGFTCSDLGVNTVTLTVTDVSGNVSTCTAIVTVIDDINPIVTCPPLQIDTTLLNDCRFVVPDYSLILNATDNCTPFDSLTFTQTPLPGTVIDYSTGLNDINSLSVSITTTDLENNSTTCNFDVLIGCRVNASIPQIFSPNGDGRNDKLYVYGANFSSFQFIVYNRWGEKVFETNDVNTGWDGTFRGVPVQEGVYVYYFRGETEQFGEIERKGDVTIVR